MEGACDYPSSKGEALFPDFVKSTLGAKSNQDEKRMDTLTDEIGPDPQIFISVPTTSVSTSLGSAVECEVGKKIVTEGSGDVKSYSIIPR